LAIIAFLWILSSCAVEPKDETGSVSGRLVDLYMVEWQDTNAASRLMYYVVIRSGSLPFTHTYTLAFDEDTQAYLDGEPQDFYDLGELLRLADDDTASAKASYATKEIQRISDRERAPVAIRLDVTTR
jgi:hypothetical protein